MTPIPIRSWLAVAAVLAGTAAAASAQAPRPGALVRVESEEAPGSFTRGELVRLTPESVLLRPSHAPGDSLSFSADAVQRLEVGRRAHSAGDVRRIVLMTAAGSAPGIYLGLRGGSDCEGCPSDKPTLERVLLTTGAGALLGGLLGHRFFPRTIRWTPVPLPGAGS